MKGQFVCDPFLLMGNFDAVLAMNVKVNYNQ